MAPRQGACPGAIPGNRTNFHRPRVSLRDRVSKTQFARGSTEAACQINSWGRGRQVMHLPCKQVDVGALPTDSTISLRGTRLKHRAKPHKLRQAGVIPAPATNIYMGSDPARGL